MNKQAKFSPIYLTEKQFCDYMFSGTFSPDHVTYGDFEKDFGPNEQDNILKELKRRENLIYNKCVAETNINKEINDEGNSSIQKRIELSVEKYNLHNSNETMSIIILIYLSFFLSF